MTFKTWSAVICSAVLLAGCATEVSLRTDCDWAVPIRPSTRDQLTDGTARQILGHNETGAEVCGWLP